MLSLCVLAIPRSRDAFLRDLESQGPIPRNTHKGDAIRFYSWMVEALDAGFDDSSVCGINRSGWSLEGCVCQNLV